MLDFRRTRDSLAQLGHDLDWRFVGPACNNRPGDPGWVATLDGVGSLNFVAESL